jgi:CDP-paratose 2-epimerase
MAIALVTGSGGLVGSEACLVLASKGLTIYSIDNDMRRQFFGPAASTEWRVQELKLKIADFQHFSMDMRDVGSIEELIKSVGRDLAVVVHAAAQPSHDWAAQDPHSDFAVNALGTLNLLEAVRRHAPHAAFVFLSTNKVYGDRPNTLPLVETATRWEIEAAHPYYSHGIDEGMSVDQTLHSLFGASKLAADVLVQEYGRYFGINTVCFRCGCLSGSGHSGAENHGFLSYLMKCTELGLEYTVYGYGGKQVRDNLHASDLMSAIWEYIQGPRPAAVYNLGGGRRSNCSILEAIERCQEIAGKKLRWTYTEENRIGDHIWWISDTSLFSTHYPAWRICYDVDRILLDIHEKGRARWTARA